MKTSKDKLLKLLESLKSDLKGKTLYYSQDDKRVDPDPKHRLYNETDIDCWDESTYSFISNVNTDYIQKIIDVFGIYLFICEDYEVALLDPIIANPNFSAKQKKEIKDLFQVAKVQFDKTGYSLNWRYGKF
ncbi:MAG: hypothetical protein KF802_02460 [Bdellovibrionaceae bacterium]|nr:hypothetical protein [Pseudobdellovibrionaceae bacterium]